MKKLFAIIFSLSLIMAPVGNTGKAHAAGAPGGMLQQLFGIGTGIVGSTILTKCTMGSMQASVMIFMAGSVVYILGEMMTAKDKKKSLDAQATDLAEFKQGQTGVAGGDVQREILDKQIESEEENLKVIQKRKKFVTATLVVYAAATIMAIIENWWRLPPPAGLAKPDMAACTIGAPMGTIKSMMIATAYGMLTNGELSAMGLVSGAGVAMGTKVLAGKLLAGTNAADGVISGPMNSATGRAIIFGVLTGVVGLIVGELGKAEKEAKKRIADLKKVRDSLPKDETGMMAGTSSPTGDPVNNNVDPSKLSGGKLKQLGVGAMAKRDCYSSNQKEYSSSACASPFKMPRVNISGSNLNIPVLTEGMNAGADLADSLASGDAAAADVQAGKLASMAGRMNKVKDELVKRMNDQLVKEGKKPINFDDESKKMMNSFAAELKKGGFTGNLASMESGEAAVSEAVKEAESNAPTAISAAAPVIDPNSAAGMDLKGLEEIGADATGADADANKAASLSDSLEDFESNESDISKDTSVSIFKQLSNRYILNYTKIFNRKEAAPETAPAEAPAN